MGQEIERKWLIDKLPEGILDGIRLEHYPHTRILQGYLCTDPVVRVRRDGDCFYLTCKNRGKLSRTEYELPLTEDAFDKLLRKADGIVLEKERYRIPVQDGLTIELDVFYGDYQGLIYAEVEFPDKKRALRFDVPGWFGRELTYEKGWSNASLSLAKPPGLC